MFPVMRTVVSGTPTPVHGDVGCREGVMANHIVVTVKDRKVKLLSETDDTSLYALCRRWVRNDVPRKDQVEYSILFRILLEWFTKEIF
jgi:hypothetical protein